MQIREAVRTSRMHAFTVATLLLLTAGARGVLAQNDDGAGSKTTPTPDPQPTAAAGFISEPHVLTKGINLAIDTFGDGNAEKKSGFYPELSNMIAGSGWVSIGPGYRQYLFDKRAVADVSAAVSWRFYKMVQGRFEYSDLADKRLAVGAQAMWQDNTQVNYYGFGPHSSEDNHTQYRVQTTDIVGYASYRPNDWLTVNGELGWLLPPVLKEPGGWFKLSLPDTQEFFPNQPGASLSRQPNFLHSLVSVAGDTRDYPGHPTSGGLYRAALTTYSDRTNETFSFNEYEAEAMQMIPLVDSRWVLGLRAWTVMTSVPSGHAIPFYLQPTIGGNNTLRGYKDYRLHDNNALLVNAESRWALFTHLDGAVFFDAGNVAARAGDLNLEKTSVGAGLRLHTKEHTFARLDVARSPSDGWQVFLRTSDPLRLSRVARRIASVPFVP
jgi:hypothetical protein